MHVAVSAAVTLSGFTSLGWWRQVHHYVPIGLVGALSWTVWLTRFTLSRVYRKLGVRSRTGLVRADTHGHSGFTSVARVTPLIEGSRSF